LTKFYAVPGLRLGALIGDEDRIRGWRSLREPWQVNVLAEEAGITALQDEEHAKASLRMVEKERTWLFNKVRLLPKANPEHPSANYLFVRLGYSATALAAHLLERKILIRNCAAWPGVVGEAIRTAVRTRSENERLLAAWEEFPCA
jgi:threonine-phosphate decarboxylase